MKKVWVNRFNTDGSLKPISEWVQRECMERYTHTYPLLNDGHGFDGGGLPAHHCFISSFGKIAESGFFYEYIGDQRGDAWFYVADGEMPPSLTDVWISDGCDYDKDHVDIDSNTGAEYFVNSGDSVICWQPIQRPQAACKEPT